MVKSSKKVTLMFYECVGHPLANTLPRKKLSDQGITQKAADDVVPAALLNLRLVAAVQCRRRRC